MGNVQTRRYTFLGGGIIAGVFIERLIKAGGVPPGQIMATDIRPERLDLLRGQFGICVSANNSEGAEFGDVVFLAVPPNVVKAVLTDVRERLPADAVILSLAAMIPTALLEEALGRPLPVVRVIPNTPSWIGQGMNPHCLGRHVSAGILPFVDELLGLFGRAWRIEEPLMNAATALTAVGPTYVFPVIKALKDAAAGLGLAPGDAQLAAAQTVLGAAQLVLETGKDPEELKMMIGTRTLKEEEASSIFKQAVQTAFEKILASEKKLTAAG
jgi:pyrroline-5-carboxylate reductase